MKYAKINDNKSKYNGKAFKEDGRNKIKMRTANESKNQKEKQEKCK